MSFSWEKIRIKIIIIVPRTSLWFFGTESVTLFGKYRSEIYFDDTYCGISSSRVQIVLYCALITDDITRYLVVYEPRVMCATYL